MSNNKLCNCDPIQNSSIENTLLTTKKTAKSIPSLLLSVLIAFFPKCPLCWGVYMSMFGSIKLAQIPYMGWLLPVLCVFFGIHLFILFKKRIKVGYLPFILSLAGSIIILNAKIYFPQYNWLLFTGMALILSGSLYNSFSINKLKVIPNSRFRKQLLNRF